MNAKSFADPRRIVWMSEWDRDYVDGCGAAIEATDDAPHLYSMMSRVAGRGPRPVVGKGSCLV